MTDEGLPAKRFNRILTAIEIIKQSLGILARKQQADHEEYKSVRSASGLASIARR